MMDHSCPCSQNSWYHLQPIYNPYSLKFISFGCLLWRISDISLSERDIVWKSVDVWIIEYVSYSVDRFFLGSGSMSSLSLLPKSCMEPSITSAILFVIWFWFKTYNWSQHSKSLPSPPLGGSDYDIGCGCLIFCHFIDDVAQIWMIYFTFSHFTIKYLSIHVKIGNKSERNASKPSISDQNWKNIEKCIVII